ncbi:glycosyltransferase family 4 protein [Dokdonia sp. Hel_I_53]|uniref:glycosyltransferase family 4 protein n=1 Tax=Dokdonia sp. Hel_I_53 TaxID=1566287 RepID=UPI00119B5794|nr:glycosyltransferase family 4 protein [Dokdonia sp. Hel_I_53]TVZ51714.1 hypothetical protein OD90_0866 [Dokdonia sp. Hel_I_53]
MRDKKVLIIAYYWPPAGGPGVQRWLKFVKYLPEFGYEPIVYVPENPSYPIVDQSLITEIPAEVTVVKRPIKEPYGWASTLSRKRTKTISSGIVPKQKKQSLLEKLMLFVRGNFFIPDARVGWVQPSITFLKKYIAEHQIEAIITTGPPHSLHLIGKGLKDWQPTLKWYADFRDPWTTIGYHDKLKMTTKTKATHKRLESEVLNIADHVIVTSPGTQKEFGHLTSKPITVLTNGYDDRPPANHKKNSKFTLAHIGSLLSDRNPQVLWKVLGALCDENADFKKNVSLQLVGKVSSEIIVSIQEAGLESILDLKGYVSHQKAQQYQVHASALVLIEINEEHTKGIIAGKIFEYLAAQRPIIAIGPRGADIEHILKTTEAGIFVDYDGFQKLKIEILELYTNWLQGNETYNGRGIEKYHRREITKALAQLLTQ